MTDDGITYAHDWSQVAKLAAEREQARLRGEAETKVCPRCRAGVGRPCIAKAGMKMTAGGFHLARHARFRDDW